MVDAPRFRSGPRNCIEDVAGLHLGHADDERLKSGTTVLIGAKPFRASVDVMGGAPGTRETDCLAPDRLVDAVHALVLSGGSAFGLDAASGVADILRQRQLGFEVGPMRVPIVPAAILFDLLAGGEHDWRENPYRGLGIEAVNRAFASLERASSANRAADPRSNPDEDGLAPGGTGPASSEHSGQGSIGAGTGATTANLKGGLGSASVILENGITVAAVVAANPHGSVVAGPGGEFHAAPFELDSEFGGVGIASADTTRALEIPQNEKLAAFEAARANTTLAIVATDADLDKAQLQRLAISAQDGMARAIVPSHSPYDGDLVFAVSTARRALSDRIADPMLLGHAAAICVTRAIARGVYHAEARSGDTLPTWRSRYG